ncbi:MAG TPA: hypothetical protein VGJ19_05445 [Streptosporangiaceae bacterium]
MPEPTQDDSQPGEARGPSAGRPSGHNLDSANVDPDSTNVDPDHANVVADHANADADLANASADPAENSRNAAKDSLDPAAAGLDPPEPGMWLTASAWLPAAVLDALQEPEPVDGVRGLEAALSQGGPLDAMPPGPVLAAFLTEASAPTAASAPSSPGPADRPLSAPAPGTPAARPPESGPGMPSHTATTDSMAARIASGAGAAQHGDNALLGLIRGWRRVASLAAAAELAAVHEFSRRRHDQAKADGAWDSTAIDAADVELAAALTLTTRSTQLLMDRAAMLHELPATAAALAAGQIDWPRALVLINGLAGQEPDLARRIEDQLIGRAPQQTTGQLRAALNRALLATDPEAAERRRQSEEQHARIERGPEPGGVTALLAGRCLPVTDTVTAWNRITALARQLRAAGADGNLDQLRVHVYLALLNGQVITAPSADTPLPIPGSSPTPTDSKAPAGSPAPDGSPTPLGSPSSGPAGSCSSADLSSSAGGPAPAPAPGGRAAQVEPRRLTGHINLTVPLRTLAGFDDGPGQLNGFGPITGSTARHLANGALGQPGIRWCVTVTNDQGQAVGHGCATRIQPVSDPPCGTSDPIRSRAAPITPTGPVRQTGPVPRTTPAESGWRFTMKLTALAGSACDHTRESPHYRDCQLTGVTGS